MRKFFLRIQTYLKELAGITTGEELPLPQSDIEESLYTICQNNPGGIRPSDVPGGDVLESDFLTIHKETIEVGENTVANGEQYVTYLTSIKSIPGDFIGMSIHKKASYVNNEWANGAGVNGYRYRDGSWNSIAWNNFRYDAVVPVGTLVDVYSVELKNPVNVR